LYEPNRGVGARVPFPVVCLAIHQMGWLGIAPTIIGGKSVCVWLSHHLVKGSNGALSFAMGNRDAYMCIFVFCSDMEVVDLHMWVREVFGVYVKLQGCS